MNFVKLTYFRPSGKYYGEGGYQTAKTTAGQVFEEVAQMIDIEGENPGLVEWAAHSGSYFVLVEPDDSIEGAHPCLLTPERRKLLLH